MYKILIKTKSMNKELFNYYMVSTIDTETQQEVVVPFSTDNLETLASKYKELMTIYPTEQIKLIHELEPEIVVEVSE